MIKEIPLPELAAAIRPFGVDKSYHQLFLLAASGAFPVHRENRLIFAIGGPEYIAGLIQAADERRVRKSIASARNARKHKTIADKSPSKSRKAA